MKLSGLAVTMTAPVTISRNQIALLPEELGGAKAQRATMMGFAWVRVVNRDAWKTRRQMDVSAMAELFKGSGPRVTLIPALAAHVASVTILCARTSVPEKIAFLARIRAMERLAVQTHALMRKQLDHVAFALEPEPGFAWLT